MRNTVLNVDDHDAGRYARSRVLRSAGFEVLEAATGAQALELATNRQPQLVLLDVNLPDMTGYEVCRQIKVGGATSRILVLHVSATFVQGTDQKRGLEGGADGYLAEPVDPEVLIATVQAFLRLRQTEEALRESEERFRRAFEDAPIGMALVNADRRIVRSNKALWEILGYTPEELADLPDAAWHVAHEFGVRAAGMGGRRDGRRTARVRSKAQPAKPAANSESLASSWKRML